MDDKVPQDHLLRIIDEAIGWSFIYELVEEKYSQHNGRPSMALVMLINIRAFLIKLSGDFAFIMDELRS